MMEYRIIVGGDIETLEARVRDAIAEGWVPLGGAEFGPAIWSHEVYTAAQAMTRGAALTWRLDIPAAKGCEHSWCTVGTTGGYRAFCSRCGLENRRRS